jgi:enterochelin esterase family protein
MLITLAAIVLSQGMHLDRTLAPGNDDVYTAQLPAGAAIIGHADQHGVDVVIEIYSPTGEKLATVDSPNGTEGPEPLRFTAMASGEYRFVVHMLDKTAAPGKYTMIIDKILSARENAERLAAEKYPPAFLALWRAAQTDPNAVASFVASRKGKGPIVEDNGNSERVTYVYDGDENTEAVRVSGGPHQAVGGILMTRFLNTPLFYATENVPRDARFRYGFNEIKTRHLSAGVEVSDERQTIDALNPETFGGLSVLTMPDAAPQPYIARDPSTPAGSLTHATLKSATLNEERPLFVYTPPGFDKLSNVDLVIVFDGDTYGGGGEGVVLIPTPTILDNLIAAKKIRPVVAVLIPNSSGHRSRDLGPSAPFAEFIATELIPWARANYRIAPGPEHVVVAGSSRGGFAAAFCALQHPDVIGNVLSQSGSFWITNSDPNSTYPYAAETGMLIDAFKKSPRLPIRFYMEIGRFDSAVFMLPTNRELRDVLEVKGYDVTYREFDSGHDYLWWRGSLADGLIAVLR